MTALYLVPVPIGNLGDITLRAIEVLKKVDIIIAEDSRYSQKLLYHLNIKKRIISYFKAQEKEKADWIIELINEKEAALITDSGTPLISDPGFILVQKALAKGIRLEALPGPTAFVPALTVSGIPSDRFLFLGFPPRQKGELMKYLANLESLPFTLVFYQSPRRVEFFLKIAQAVLGNRKFAIVKELSKKNEKVIRGYLDSFAEIIAREVILGEMVIIIHGNEQKKSPILKLNSLDDLYRLLKDHFHIGKKEIKQILYKRKGD